MARFSYRFAVLHARISDLPLIGRGLLSGLIDRWHVFLPNAVRAREHLASLWLDLAEGRLRLDRLDRNGCGKTFFPWTSTPR